MKKATQKVPEWILIGKKESKLSAEDKQIYYEKLREYCFERKLTNTTIGATTISPKLKKATNFIARKLSDVLAGRGVKFVTDGLENIPKEQLYFRVRIKGY